MHVLTKTVVLIGGALIAALAADPAEAAPPPRIDRTRAPSGAQSQPFLTTALPRLSPFRPRRRSRVSSASLCQERR